MSKLVDFLRVAPCLEAAQDSPESVSLPLAPSSVGMTSPHCCGLNTLAGPDRLTKQGDRCLQGMVVIGCPLGLGIGKGTFPGLVFSEHDLFINTSSVGHGSHIDTRVPRYITNIV